MLYRTLFFILTIALTLPTPSFGASALTPNCGDTVGPGGSFTLTQDLVGCAGPGPALRVVGPVRLDLNGRTISCAGSPTGIEISERKARVSGGRVADCATGIDTVGERHRLTAIAVTGWTTTGIGIQGDSNRVTACETSLTGPAEAGSAFRIDGVKNRVRENTVLGATGMPSALNGYGFDVSGEENRILQNEAFAVLQNSFHVTGHDNQIDRNVAHGAQFGDYSLPSGTDNQFSKNIGEANEAPAFLLSGQDNLLRSNTALGSAVACAVVVNGIDNTADSNEVTGIAGGICVSGTSNEIRDNEISITADCALCIEGQFHQFWRNSAIDSTATPTDTIGFDIDGERHNFVSNDVTGMGTSGFLVQATSLGQFFGRNEAIGNNRLGDPNHYDFRDDNPGCGLNRFDRNRIATRNQECVRSVLLD